jgi:NTP pyrophosphatase (non-canonical NTP hydrolase)
MVRRRALTRLPAAFTVAALSGARDMNELDALTQRLREFAAARGWHRSDNAKDLAIAVMVEAAELMEHFQWLAGQDSAGLAPEKRAAVELEIADVLIFLLRLADTVGVDPMASAWRKIELNAARYPAAKVRGRALKYSDIERDDR